MFGPALIWLFSYAVYTNFNDYIEILDIIKHNGNAIKSDLISKDEYQQKNSKDIISEIENRYLYLLGNDEYKVINMSITLLK